jgi:1,4-dihydroxy-2-naphthoyl-CoA synthase
VPGEHPVLGHPDGVAKQGLAAVGRPAGQAGAEALCAGSQQEVLHRREDRSAEQHVRCQAETPLDEQHRRELARAVVQFVRGPVVAGAMGVVVGGGSGQAVRLLDHRQRLARRLRHDGTLLG